MSHHPTSRAMTAIGAAAVVAMLTAASFTYGGAGDCSQPISDGTSPTALDCVFILRAAIGFVSCDPVCICDPSGDDSITPTDALICIRRAVGMNVPQLCCGVTTTTDPNATTTTTTPGVCAAPGEACAPGRRCCSGAYCQRSTCCGAYRAACTQNSDCCSHHCFFLGGRPGRCSLEP